MSHPELAVVVVNFNSSEYARAALHSVAQQLEGREWEAALIDNASTDGRTSCLADLPPRVKVYRNRVNLGFGRAVNQGLVATRAPLVLLLNPDSIPRPGAVDILRRELEDWPECAAVGPDILNPDGTRQGSARGDPDLLTGLFGRSTLLSRVFPRLYWVRKNIRLPGEVPPGESGLPVDWVSGACVLLRRSAVEAVGGFDVRYFLYWEDADLGRRLRAAGYSVRYVPAATVTHAMGQSSRTVHELSVREFHRSAYRYYSTHVAPSPWNPARLVARTVLALRCRYYLRKAENDNPEL